MVVSSVAGTVGWILSTGSWELQDGLDAACLAGPELTFSGPVTMREGTGTSRLEVLENSGHLLEAVRRDEKLSRMNMQPQGRTGCQPHGAERLWQGHPEHLLPGHAWPQSRGTWLFASYLFLDQRSWSTPSW